MMHTKTLFLKHTLRISESLQPKVTLRSLLVAQVICFRTVFCIFWKGKEKKNEKKSKILKKKRKGIR